MNIGIDVDDVITDTSIEMKDYIIQYDENGELSNYMEDVMRGDMTNLTIKKFFAEKSAEIFSNAKMKDNANKVIKRWLNDGNEIFIITSRGEIKFEGSEKITTDYLNSHNIPYTKILFNSFEKAKICKDNNIDIMIDDSEKNCKQIADEGIKSILFTSEVNKKINTTIERADNWLELEKKVEKIINSK